VKGIVKGIPWNDDNGIGKHQGCDENGKQYLLSRKPESGKAVGHQGTGGNGQYGGRKNQDKGIDEK